MERQRLSAGVVVAHGDAAPFRYLLLRSYRYWDFPKGLVEPGEAPMAAARREVAEEAGLVKLNFRWGGCFLETPPYARGKVARYYIAASPVTKVSLPFNPTLGKAEHHAYRWVPYRVGRDLLGARVSVVLDWAHDVIGDVP